MKRQRSGTGAKPSRFCRLLLLAAGFKLCLLGSFLLDPLDFGAGLFSGNGGASVQTAGVAGITGEAAADGLAAPGKGSGVALPAGGQPGKKPSGVAYAAEPAPEQPADKAENSGDRLSMEALNRRQEELARKEQSLKALENELNGRLEEMKALENRLQVMLKDAEEAKDAKFKHLVDVLSNMKARQAAGVLETLDEKIAVRVLAGMRGRQAGEILTFAAPAKAARLAEALARMQIPLE